MNFFSDIDNLQSAQGRVKHGFQSYENLDLQDEGEVILWAAEQEKTVAYFGLFFYTMI